MLYFLSLKSNGHEEIEGHFKTKNNDASLTALDRGEKRLKGLEYISLALLQASY